MEEVRRIVKKNGIYSFLSGNIILLLVGILSLRIIKVVIFSNGLLNIIVIALLVLLQLYLFLKYKEKKSKIPLITALPIYSKYIFLSGLILLSFNVFCPISLRSFLTIDFILNLTNILKPFILTLTISAGVILIILNDNFGQILPKRNHYFKPILLIISTIFITSRLILPILYEGSFIDEYFHILSGIEFFKTGHFAQLYHNTAYTRGSYVSVFVGLFMALFGETIFVAKMLPATLGIVNYFLLYFVGKRFFKNKISLTFLLLTYTVIPWLLFNHFYIRMYVFYEFFTLALTVFFLLMIENIEKMKTFIIYLTITLLLLGSVYFFSNDQGKYPVLIYGFILLSYIFFFEAQKLDIKNKFFSYITKNFKFKIISFSFCLIGIFTYLGGVSLLESFLFSELAFTNAPEYKYANLFFNLNIFYTVFFLISISQLLNKNISREIKAIIFSSGILFLIHFLSSLDLQITRGIIYFLPIFYTVSTLGVSTTLGRFKSNIPRILVVVLLIVSITKMYPIGFFSVGPYIPTDVDYREYKKTSMKVGDLSKEDTVILTHFPHIYRFYNKEISNDIYLLRDNFNSYYYTPSLKYLGDDNNYYYSLSNDKIVEDSRMFKDILDRNNDVILLLDNGVTYGWVTGSSKSVISKDFEMVWEYGEIKIFLEEK